MVKEKEEKKHELEELRYIYITLNNEMIVART